MSGPVHWVKVTDPAAWTEPPAGADVRVLLPDTPAFDALRERLAAAGVPVRAVRHWVEDETVTTTTTKARQELIVRPRPCDLAGRFVRERLTLRGPSAAAARDAFDMAWQANAPDDAAPATAVAAAALVPAAWLPMLAHPTLNPAQAQAAPWILAHSGHVMVVAPTGAGKTTIGMLAALRTVLEQRRKAVWLVPQRSLTDELDRELQTWRRHGLKVERLSGEHAVDVARVRDADVWVATTEKFEAICRSSSLQQALADVGCLVVDEVHLLGDHTRGPVLEALLARVRGEASTVRIVGLSATVANAAEIADWLGAQLVPVTWRPTRLTWQLPMIPATSDWKAATAARTRLAVALTRQVTDDKGSVLVFCGSRNNVRVTALAIAADRGARTGGVDPADETRVHEVCTAAGVGLHYKDWPFKRDAEHAFRHRQFDVLVATTTVAAGVNLPARAVVVRDTSVGLDQLSVSTVQQMFGRAGRVGAGETAGFAYLICDETERSGWQRALVAGYTVESQLRDTLPDSLLAESAQGRISTLREGEAWWQQTLAFHQGGEDLAAVSAAIGELVTGEYVTTVGQAADDADLTPTELGHLTTRLMVFTGTGTALRTALAKARFPTSADRAEDLLIDLLALTAPELAEAPISEEARAAVARVLQAGGRLERLGKARTFTRGGLGAQAPFTPGDLAKAALKIAAHSPSAIRGGSGAVAGIPAAAMYPIWEQAPRYLHWLAGQGYLAAVHPWVAVVAGDLARRIRWRALAPPRGAGRLLWMCEQMATPPHLRETVPVLYRAARSRDVTGPDWSSATMPAACRLDPADYTTLLRDRTTGTDLTAILAPAGATVTTWSGDALTHHQSTGDRVAVPDAAGVAVFTRRGDATATGWLETYHHIGA